MFDYELHVAKGGKTILATCSWDRVITLDLKGLNIPFFNHQAKLSYFNTNLYYFFWKKYNKLINIIFQKYKKK